MRVDLDDSPTKISYFVSTNLSSIFTSVKPPASLRDATSFAPPSTVWLSPWPSHGGAYDREMSECFVGPFLVLLCAVPGTLRATVHRLVVALVVGSKDVGVFR